MEASIVIRTKNEAALLRQTLRSIHAQHSEGFEVIVVDSGSTDNTVDIVREFSDIKLIEIPPHRFTYGRALNIGITESAGHIVVFLSGHAIPSGAGWLTNLLRHFDDPRVAAVYGRQLPHQNAFPCESAVPQLLYCKAEGASFT
jgi:rhamnosyltransferase